MIVVTATKWDDPDGVSVREIGRLVLRPIGKEGDLGDYMFTLDEGPHPIVPRPLKARGKIEAHPRRQTVWDLINRAVVAALRQKNTQ